MKNDLFAPQAGAIWLVWFPESEEVFSPGPKFRPAVILDANRKQDGTLEVLVAYGTTKRTKERRLDEFVVRAEQPLRLRADTKFKLGKLAWLPVTEQWFSKAGACVHLGNVPLKSMQDFMLACRAAGLV